MTKAIVAFIYTVGTIQTVFALHDFYTIFVLPDPRDHFTFYDTTWSLRSYEFFWITIPLSGASGAPAFRFHFISLLPHSIWRDSGRRFPIVLCSQNTCAIK